MPIDPSVISSIISGGSSLASGGLGILAANASSKKQYKYQSRLQAQAAKLNYHYALKSAENMPSATRKGLEAGGYNPMLAVQNSTSGANSSWTSSGQASAPDYLSGLSNAFELQRVKNETAQTDSLVDLQSEQSKTEQSKRRNLEFQNAMLDVEKHLKDEDLKHYEKRFYTEMYQMMQEAEKLRQEASVVGYNAESYRIMANAQKEANVNQADYNDILRGSTPSGKSVSFKNYTSGVRDVMSGFGDIIHGRNDNYEYYSDTREVQNGPKGRTSEKVTSKRSGRRKKR